MDLLLGALAIASLSLPMWMNLARHHASLLFTVVLLIACFVPYWRGPSFGQIFVPILTLTMTIAALALVLIGGNVRWRWPDSLMLLFCVAVLCASVAPGGSLASSLSLLTQWLVPYVFGRFIAQRLSFDSAARIITILAIIVGSWAVIELLTNIHPFAGDGGTIWSSIQYRAGLPRSEGAMGTSIVLGNALAMTIPFVLLSPHGPWTRLIALSLVLAGSLSTFSRNALVAIVLAFVLTFLLARFRQERRRSRPVVFGAICAALALAILPFLSNLGSTASTELNNSTLYRSGYVALLPGVQLVGPSADRLQTATGTSGYVARGYAGGLVTSIDNAPLYIALEFGWIAALSLTLLLLGLGFLGLRRATTNPALITLVALLPTVFTLAMVTQFPAFYWLLAGAGVTTWAQHSVGQVDTRSARTSRSKIGAIP